jgi:hypothetical protein
MSKDPGPRGMCPGVSENASTRAVETCPIPPRHGSDGPALDRPSDGKGVLDQTIWANVCAFRQQVADPRDVSARSNRAPGASRPEGNKTAPPLDDIPVPAPGGPGIPLSPIVPPPPPHKLAPSVVVDDGTPKAADAMSRLAWMPTDKKKPNRTPVQFHGFSAIS